MVKIVQSFKTISEVANEIGVATHVLRFWETKFSEIQPMKRNGGRRYYRSEDVELLQGIKTYLHDRRYTIEGVQKLLKQKGWKAIVSDGVAEVADVSSSALNFLNKPLELNDKDKEVVSSLIVELKNMRNSLQLSLDLVAA